MDREIKNISAERIVIGTLINNPEWILELNGVIKTDNFFMKSHKTLFHLITLLLSEGYEVIDSMTILARAEKIAKATEVLVESGGLEYIEEIKFLSETTSLDDLKKHAEEVANCSFKRELMAKVENIQNEIVKNPNWKISDVDYYVQQDYQSLLAKYENQQEVGMLADVFDEAWSELEENRQGGVSGLPTKFPSLNKFFTYLNGELTVIGGRPKYGKSSWAINEIHNLAVNLGIPVAYFDTEMKTRTFLNRIISLDSGVPASEILNGNYLNDIDKVMAVEASKERIKNAPIIHKYDAHWDRPKVARMAKLLKLKYNIGFLVYDYIKVKEIEKNSVKENSELGNWTIFLKDLAGDLDIPILTFGQMSPYERRLADSDKINRYASLIAYLLPKSKEEIQRDFGVDEGGGDYIYIDYNRNGASMQGSLDPSKGVNFIYKRNTISMREAPYQHQDIIALTED